MQWRDEWFRVAAYQEQKNSQEADNSGSAYSGSLLESQSSLSLADLKHSQLNKRGYLIPSEVIPVLRHTYMPQRFGLIHSPQAPTYRRHVSMRVPGDRFSDLGDAAIQAVDTIADAAVFVGDAISGRAMPADGTPPYLQLYRGNLDKQGSSLWEAQGWATLDDQELVHSMFLSNIDLQGKKVLDVGCGQGDFAEFLEMQGVVPARLRGIDGIPEFVQSAQRKAPPWAEYRVGDPLDDPSVLGSQWDCVILSSVISTQALPEAQRLLADCWRVTREVMAFTFPVKPPGAFGMRARLLGSKNKGHWAWCKRPKHLLKWANKQVGVKSVHLLDKYVEGSAMIIMRREVPL